MTASSSFYQQGSVIGRLFGTTAQRPPVAAYPVFFDTTLGRPVFWNGVTWIDSIGTNTGGTTGGGTTNVAPTFTNPVTISGPAISGGVLTATPGTVTGTPTPSVSYQWNRSGVPISGANTLTYSVFDVDVGATLSVTETATNGVGVPAISTSSSTAVVAPSTTPNGILDFSDANNSAQMAAIGIA